jgi:hypothetical protein
MKRFTGSILGFVLAVMLGTALAQVIQRPRNPQNGLSPGLTYFMAGSEPTGGPDGEIAVRFNRGATPEFVVFSVADSAWRPMVAGSGVQGVPVAGASGSVSTIAATLNPMNGSDTVNGLAINLTNADHTGSSNFLNGVRVGNIIGDAEAVESAYSFGTGWDVGLDAQNLASGNAFLMMPNTSLVTVRNVSNNRIASFSDQSSPNLGVVNSDRGFLGTSGTKAFSSQAGYTVAMNGGDNTAAFDQLGFTDANHTSTANFFSALYAGTISTPDADAIHSGVRVEAGYDALLMGEVRTTAWSATENPPANEVAIFLDESGANCNLTARLASGVEVVIIALVVAGDCP